MGDELSDELSIPDNWLDTPSIAYALKRSSSPEFLNCPSPKKARNNQVPVPSTSSTPFEESQNLNSSVQTINEIVEDANHNHMTSEFALLQKQKEVSLAKDTCDSDLEKEFPNVECTTNNNSNTSSTTTILPVTEIINGEHQDKSISDVINISGESEVPSVIEISSSTDNLNVTFEIATDKISEADNLETSPALIVGESSTSKVSSEELTVLPSTSKEAKDKTCLKKITSVVRDANIISGIVGCNNFNTIYDMLVENKDRADRLDIVTSRLLDDSLGPSTSDRDSTSCGNTSGADIFDQVQLVMNSVPAADANQVYTILESLPPTNTRVNKTLELLKRYGHIVTAQPTLLKKKSLTVTADRPSPQNDPLLRDIDTIGKMFPDKDRNTIFAMLEAHKGENRLQNVIDEMLKNEGANTNVVNLTQPSTSGAVVSDKEESMDDDIERMKILFPDCDPKYLFERLSSMKDTENSKDVLAAELFDKRDYPKIKDVLEKAERKKKEQRIKNLNITAEEFKQKFEYPEKTFSDETKVTSALYKTHAETALRNDFKILQAGFIKLVLVKHNYHFYPAYNELSASVISVPLNERKQHKRFLKNLRSSRASMPEQGDEYFYHELWFVQNEQKLKDLVMEKVEERKRKIEEAKINGELYECSCCYDDECLFEDMASCSEGHLFCKVCVVRSTEAAFGDMKTKFPCLTGDCDQQIALSTLQAIIHPNLFSKIVGRLQEEEVQQANIPDLVSCPFCPFATIMPDADDKVFKCLNSDCLKDSCRLCQEPSHIPLRCNEVEKKSATSMRTYIENSISEAVMRKCHKCGKNFIKDTGCNKMTCMCGASSCYACKAQDIDYGHFNNNTSCATIDPNTIHQRDMEKAALEAKNQYLIDHPEAVEVELKSDIGDMIEDYRTLTGAQVGQPIWLGGDSDSEIEEDSEDIDDPYHYRFDYYRHNRHYEDTTESDEDDMY